MGNRTFESDDDLLRFADTTKVTVTEEVKEKVSNLIKSGKITIKNGEVLYKDPELGDFSASDTYPVNLEAGFVCVLTPDKEMSVILPLELEFLAELRNKVGYKRILH